jgi:hypothetical protein
MKRLLGILLASAVPAFSLGAQEAKAPLPYRTESGDPKLPWYRLEKGKFPPPESEMHLGATLVSVDTQNRSGVYRDDAHVTDAQARYISFRMLPYGRIFRCGAPAELGDIPPGTHVWLDLFQDKQGEFTQATLVCDDFSACATAGRMYRIEQVKLDHRRVAVVPLGGDGAAGKQVEWFVDDQSRLWKGRSLAEGKDLSSGQTILANLSVGTATVPVVDRCQELWIDEESRTLATSLQRKRTLARLKERGVPAWVDSVDHPDSKVTITLFDSGYPEALAEFKAGAAVALAVGEETLKTYEPDGGQGGPDQVRSTVAEVRTVPASAGSSGLQVIVSVPYILEGFRPAHILRVCPRGYQFRTCPPEERILK